MTQELEAAQNQSRTKRPPVSVEVDNVEPLRVEIEDDDDEPTPVMTKSGEMSLPPTTTREEDIVTAGQRRIGLLWEFTQAIIAVSVTFAFIYTSAIGIESVVLTSGFFMIIGSYFSRVNHQIIGGSGRKATDDQPYLGR